MTLPEMLIVTFGRAASQELRARVRERLTEVEHDLGEPPPMHERDRLVALLLDTTDHEIAVRRRRIRTALTQFDAATIATTHQFCQQVLRSLGVAGTTDASAVLVEDLDDVLVDVVDDLYLRAFGRASDALFFRAFRGPDHRSDSRRRHPCAVAAALRRRPTSDVGRRVPFARRAGRGSTCANAGSQVMHYNDLLTQLAGALEAPDSPARQRMQDRWRVVLPTSSGHRPDSQWQVLDRAFTSHAPWSPSANASRPSPCLPGWRRRDLRAVARQGRPRRSRRTIAPTSRRQGAGCLSQRAELGDPRIAVHPVDAAHHGSRLAGPRPAARVRLRQVPLEDHPGGKTTVGGVRHFIADDPGARHRPPALPIGHLRGSASSRHDIAVLAHRGEDLVDAQRALAPVGITAVSGGGARRADQRRRP